MNLHKWNMDPINAHDTIPLQKTFNLNRIVIVLGHFSDVCEVKNKVDYLIACKNL